jgi:hypothetical protein
MRIGGKRAHVVHRVKVLLVIGEIEGSEPRESLRLAVFGLKSFRFVAVGLFEKIRHPEYFALERFFCRDDLPLVLPESRFVHGRSSDSPAESSIDSSVPSEFAKLILVPVEGDDEDSTVGNRVEVKETDDRLDHFRFRNAIENEVLVNSKTSHLSVSLFGVTSGPVEMRVVETVRTEGRENREVGLVLEEEAKIAKGLTGRVTRRQIIAEDSIQHEGIPLRLVRVFDWRRKSFVIDKFDVRG